MRNLELLSLYSHEQVRKIFVYKVLRDCAYRHDIKKAVIKNLSKTVKK